MSTLVYTTESYKDIINELIPLMDKLAAEVDLYPEEPVIDVDHDAFIAMPTLQVITARDAGTLVGFHIATIQPDIFYKTTLTSFVMLYYMLPDYRGGGKGTNMFKFAEKMYKDKEVKRVFMSRKIYIPNEKMFDSLGYTQIEANYTKAIK